MFHLLSSPVFYAVLSVNTFYLCLRVRARSGGKASKMTWCVQKVKGRGCSKDEVVQKHTAQKRRLP